MLVVGAEDIHRLLDFPSLIEALKDMFRDGATVPRRHHHAVGPPAPDEHPGGSQGTLLLMPAWRAGEALGVKIVTVFPDNARRALTSVHGTYLLRDAATGQPRAVLDGTALTLRRNATASALAASYLAREDSGVHLMPACRAGAALGVKTVTVFPDNERPALPSVHGTDLLLDAATGQPRAVLDGTALTLPHYAAASPLSDSYLAL